MDRFPDWPEEGPERTKEVMIKMLLAEVAEMLLLGDWCDFHFDCRSDCVGVGLMAWYIGDATDPDYGSASTGIYIPKPGVEFDDHYTNMMIDWIDALHEFRWRHFNGQDIDGNKMESNNE